MRGMAATADDVFIGMFPLGRSLRVRDDPHTAGPHPSLRHPIGDIQRGFGAEDHRHPEAHASARFSLSLPHGDEPSEHGQVRPSSLRAGYLAGQISPEEIIQWGKEQNIYLSSSWGNSEVGPGAGRILPFGTPLAIRKKSVGRPVPGMRIRVGSTRQQAGSSMRAKSAN